MFELFISEKNVSQACRSLLQRDTSGRKEVFTGFPNAGAGTATRNRGSLLWGLRVPEEQRCWGWGAGCHLETDAAAQARFVGVRQRSPLCASSEQHVLILETSFSRTEVTWFPQETGFKVTVTINVSFWVGLVEYKPHNGKGLAWAVYSRRYSSI